MRAWAVPIMIGGNMADKMRSREREPETIPTNTRQYDPKCYDFIVDELDRAANGRIVVRAKERFWDVHRQANSMRYLSPHEPDLQDTATQSWEVFLQIFSERSGRHRHQGGLVIFILEGKGWTVIDGERHDWEAGDLLLLPMKPGGVEHQHFNEDPNHPVKWIALLYWPFFIHAGSETTQIETSPIFDAMIAKVADRENSLFTPVNSKEKR